MFNRNAISRALRAKGWSRYRLCKETHMAQSTLSAILSGEAKNPNTKTLQRIADALGVSVADFFDNDNSEDKDEDENLPDLEDEDTAEMKILFDKAVDKKLPPADKRRLMAIIKVFLEETSD